MMSEATSVGATIPEPVSTPGSTDNDTASEHLVGQKRRRAQLACTSRKQRCIIAGQESQCNSCMKVGIPCIMPHHTSMARFKREMIQALEQRVALLETRLSEVNPDDPLVADHLHKDAVDAPAEPSSSTPNQNEYAVGVALLSLNAASEGHYLGASSAFTWTQLIGGTLHHSPLNLYRPQETFRWRYASNERSAYPSLPSPAASAAMYETAYYHLQARYPFVDWRQMRDWLSRREKLVVRRSSQRVRIGHGDSASKGDGVLLRLVSKACRSKAARVDNASMLYAIGARLLQGSNVSGVDRPESYHAAALEHLDLIVTLHNVQNVQALVLLIMYSLRCAEGLSIRHLTSLTMGLSVELGLHRHRDMPAGSTPYAEELRKRAWWTVYTFDRWFALKLGRPLTVADADVDQEMPLDTPCDPSSDEAREAVTQSAKPPGADKTMMSSMTSAIHFIRLQRIMSDISTRTFALNVPPDSLVRAVDDILLQLDQWEASIPLNFPASVRRLPFCSPDWFAGQCESARLTLLRPFVSQASPGDRYLVACARSAARKCEIMRRLHQKNPLAGMLSLTDLHDTFLTGLTLLHCAHRDWKAFTLGDLNKAIRNCSANLFVYAQHFAAAEPFRDAFDDLASTLLDKAFATTAPVRSLDEILADRPTSEWQRHTAGMATWMTNPAAQTEFFSLVQSLGLQATPPPDVSLTAPINGDSLFPETFLSGDALFDDGLVHGVEGDGPGPAFADVSLADPLPGSDMDFMSLLSSF